MPPLSLLIKPASGSCNMRCQYCFYCDEAKKRTLDSLGHMSPQTMHQIADKAMEYADGECTFAFQGGEPTLVGLEFFKDLSNYISGHLNPKHICVQYAVQTNGYELNEEWAQWLAAHHVLVGVSLDGPRDIHNQYRLDHQGRGTFDQVMKSIHLLKKYRVDFNILTVVSSANARKGQQIYNFFKKQGFVFQQYIECLDPIGELQGGHKYSLTPQKYEVFLKNIFDCWYRDMKAGEYVYNRYFENLMMILSGQYPEGCNMRGVCSPQWVIEADGSVYPCDFYALDQWKLGNILENSFEEMEKARQNSGFVVWSQQQPEQCKTCKWLPLCRNGCRRHREPVTKNSTGINYFCTAYKNFLEYALPRLMEICQMFAN